MKAGLALIVLATSVAAVAQSGDPSPAAGREVVETVIAKVNGDIITRRKFERSFEPIRQRLMEQFKDDPTKLMEAVDRQRKAWLENMIDNLLLTQRAKSQGIKLQEDEIREYVDRLMLENNLKSQEEMVLALKAEGLDFEDFKEDLRNQGYRERLIQQEIIRTISVTDADLRKYHEEHPADFQVSTRLRVREIGLGEDRAQAEELGAKALARLKAGESFEKVAKELSTAPSKEGGGDLGWFAKGDLDEKLEEAASRLAPGQVSGVVASGYGYRILKLEERKEAGARAFEEVRDEIEERLRKEMYDASLKALVAKLRSEAQIRVKDEKGVLTDLPKTADPKAGETPATDKKS